MTDELNRPAATEELTYCAVHPDRETSLRCNKCERYMCAECAVLTPVGYRCKQCVRQHEDKFFSASQNDYIIVFATCAVLSAVGSVVVNMIGFLLFILILAFPVGGVIAEVALRLTKRRRGRYSGQVAALGVVIGGLAGGVIQTLILLWPLLTMPGRQGQNMASADFVGLLLASLVNLPLLLFVGIAAFAVYGRFRMKI
jgi:hypothetical protein